MVSFASGTTVRLHGLTGRPELNGLEGTVGQYCAPKERYAVRLRGHNDSMLLKATNLQAIIEVQQSVTCWRRLSRRVTDAESASAKHHHVGAVLRRGNSRHVSAAVEAVEWRRH